MLLFHQPKRYPEFSESKRASEGTLPSILRCIVNRTRRKSLPVSKFK